MEVRRVCLCLCFFASRDSGLFQPANQRSLGKGPGQGQAEAYNATIPTIELHHLSTYWSSSALATNLGRSTTEMDPHASKA